MNLCVLLFSTGNVNKTFFKLLTCLWKLLNLSGEILTSIVMLFVSFWWSSACWSSPCKDISVPSSVCSFPVVYLSYLSTFKIDWSCHLMSPVSASLKCLSLPCFMFIQMNHISLFLGVLTNSWIFPIHIPGVRVSSRVMICCCLLWLLEPICFMTFPNSIVSVPCQLSCLVWPRMFPFYYLVSYPATWEIVP